MLSAYVIRQIQIPFGRYTRCVQCYCVRWDHGLPGQGEICGSNPQPKQAVCLLLAFKQICCLIHQVAALINVSGFRQITLMLVVAKSWWIAVRRESDWVTRSDVPLLSVWRRSRLARRKKWRWHLVRMERVSLGWDHSGRLRSPSDLPTRKVPSLQVQLFNTFDAVSSTVANSPVF